MIACPACGRTIARTADACPGCGAKNEWVHPEIRRFVGSLPRIKTADRFQCFWAQSRVWGHAVLSTQESKVRGFGLALIGVGAAVAVLSGCLGSIGGLIFLAGIGACLVGLVMVVIHAVSDDQVFRTVKFELDFGSSPPQWTSNDEKFWRPVRDFFGV
jgi:hypothetical protein